MARTNRTKGVFVSKRHSFGSRRVNQSRSPRSAKIAPFGGLESLEPRLMLTVTPTLSNGVLTITGNANQTNTISAELNSTGSSIIATVDGVSATVATSSVTSLVIDAGSRSDSIEIDSSIKVAESIVEGKGATSSATATSASSTTTPSSTSSSASGTLTSTSTTTSSTTVVATTSTSVSGATKDGTDAHITFTTSQTLVQGLAIQVNALSSKLGAGTVLSTTYQWNFGDSGSQYNELTGWNAAHAYENAGKYTVTLTLTDANGQTSVATGTIDVVSNSSLHAIYVSPTGNDNNSGASSSAPIKSITKLDTLITNNTHVFFQDGGVYDTTGGLWIDGYANVEISSYGSGAQPVIMYDGPHNYGGIIAVNGGSNGVLIQGLTFNSIYAGNNDSAPIFSGVTLVGNNITIRDNTFLNVMDDTDLSAQPTNVLIQNNTSPTLTDLNAYFSWVQGSDIVIVGNTVANSDGESALRVGGANVLLIADNTINDNVKGSIAVQAGSYAYLYGNTIPNGPIGVGPLGTATSDSSAAFDYCVFDSNIIDTTLLIQPGSDYVMAKNNVLEEDGNPAFTINGQGLFGWQVQNVYIDNNTDIDTGPWGSFITISNGQAEGVHVDDNLFIDPQLETGEGQGLIVDNNSNLDSFSQIEDNTWAIPDPSGWAKGGYFYVNAKPGQQSGYLTPAEWQDTTLAGGGYPTGDVYENVVLGSTYSVFADGFTAGSDLVN